MSKTANITFTVTDDPNLTAAIADFAQTQFNASIQEVTPANAATTVHKDICLAAVAGAVLKTLAVIASVEGSLRFAERLQRLDRVKKLLAAIKKQNNPVYMQIEEKEPLNLTNATEDEVMTELAKLEHTEEDNQTAEDK